MATSTPIPRKKRARPRRTSTLELTENTVTFSLIAPLGHGEEPFVCGNTVLLGQGEPSEALLLHTTAEEYPKWQSDPIPVPTGCEVEYRYGVKRGGQFHRWDQHVEGMRVLPKELVEVGVRTDDTLDQEVPSPVSSPEPTSGGRDPFGSAALKAVSPKARTATEMTPPLLGNKDGVIVVSFFLPVVVTRDEASGEWHIDWDQEALLAQKTALRVTRIGTVKYSVPKEEEGKVTELLRQFNCVPIFIPPELTREFYDNFCKRTLWPVFHNLLEVYGPDPSGLNSSSTGTSHWSAYTAVQRQFKSKIIEQYHDGDLIWIHGFHLLLLPTFLSRSVPLARIGLFLHTPFPSSEIFRTLSCREDLLRGMLSADQIGFHLYEYARHFLTCCRRILGLEWTHEANGINIRYGGRSVLVTCIHAGMDQEVVHRVVEQHPVQNEIFKLMTATKDKTVFGGIDRLERLKGVPLKLMAFERFLEQHPEFVGKVVLHQVCLAVRERHQDFESTSRQVRQLADSINAKFSAASNGPVVVLQQVADASLDLPRRLPLLTVADVFIVTTVRDGLNRWPFEYVLAQAAQTGEGAEYLPKAKTAGTMILSEFTSCTRVMHGALHVNPWAIDDVANAMHTCMTMKQAEREQRLNMDLAYVTSNTTASWCANVLTDLKSVEKGSNHYKYVAIGLGLGHRVAAMDAGFHALDTANVVRQYRLSRKRLIVLDYGGTLYADSVETDDISHYAVATNVSKRSRPADSIIALLQALCNDAKNIVYVLSGKQRRDLEESLGEVKGLGLASEAGFFFRRPDASVAQGDPSEWEMLNPNIDQSWREPCLKVMELYEERTHGVYIQRPDSAAVWQFRDADPDFAHLQSKELEDQLKNILKRFNVDVIRGDDYIEVRPSGVCKGNFLEVVLEDLQQDPPDFCLCIGDDASDEGCYPVIKHFGSVFGKDRSRYFTATVGKKPSEADNYLNDISDVIEMLQSMTKGPSQRQFFSSEYLPGLAEKPATRASPMGAISELESPDSSASGTEPLAPRANVIRSMSMPVLSSQQRNTSSLTLNEYMAHIAVPEHTAGDEHEEEQDGLWF